jgi:hypothetical protein
VGIERWIVVEVSSCSFLLDSRSFQTTFTRNVQPWKTGGHNVNHEKREELKQLAKRASATVAGLKNREGQWHEQRHRLVSSLDALRTTQIVPYLGPPERGDSWIRSSVATQSQGPLGPITPPLAGLVLTFSVTPHYDILAEVTVRHPDGTAMKLEEKKYSLETDAEEMVLERVQFALDEVIKLWTHQSISL